jgi:hypothetical protein
LCSISCGFTNGGTRIHVPDIADTQQIQIVKALRRVTLDTANGGPVLDVAQSSS